MNGAHTSRFLRDFERAVLLGCVHLVEDVADAFWCEAQELGKVGEASRLL